MLTNRALPMFQSARSRTRILPRFSRNDFERQALSKALEWDCEVKPPGPRFATLQQWRFGTVAVSVAEVLHISQRLNPVCNTATWKNTPPHARARVNGYLYFYVAVLQTDIKRLKYLNKFCNIACNWSATRIEWVLQNVLGHPLRGTQVSETIKKMVRYS
ncbi:MAG: hypothetical protein AAFU34_15615 [Pseudomonadota bacterium]